MLWRAQAPTMGDVARAREVAVRIKALCQQLGEFPGMGSLTDQDGVQMLPVVRYPYNIFYMILADRDDVRVPRIRDGRRRRKPLTDSKRSD